MTSLIYAVTQGLSSIRGAGLSGAPLNRVSVGELVAVTSRHDAPPQATGRLYLEYEDVIERLMSEHDVLPARFGGWFASESAVRDMLRDRYHELLRSLGRVGGAVEFAISAGWPDGEGPSSPPVAATGTAYMLGRLEGHRRERALARRLEPLNRLARSTRQRLSSRPTLPIVGAYLVDNARVQEFAALVRRLGNQLDDVELICTGPWPPYSFAQGASI